MMQTCFVIFRGECLIWFSSCVLVVDASVTGELICEHPKLIEIKKTRPARGKPSPSINVRRRSLTHAEKISEPSPRYSMKIIYGKLSCLLKDYCSVRVCKHHRLLQLIFLLQWLHCCWWKLWNFFPHKICILVEIWIVVYYCRSRALWFRVASCLSTVDLDPDTEAERQWHGSSLLLEGKGTMDKARRSAKLGKEVGTVAYFVVIW